MAPIVRKNGSIGENHYENQNIGLLVQRTHDSEYISDIKNQGPQFTLKILVRVMMTDLIWYHTNFWQSKTRDISS